MQVEKLDLYAGRGLTETRYTTNWANRFNQELIKKVRNNIGQSRFGHDGRLREWTDTLVECVDLSFASSLGALADRTKFREPQSAQSIALNSFLRWQACPGLLPLADIEGFRELRFGGRCPTGIRGTPPYLDLIATTADSVVAVTSRTTDYLQKKKTKLAANYLDIGMGRPFEPWRDLARGVVENRSQLSRVDVASLVKFAYGLARTFPTHKILLVYLYWEPQGVGTMPLFGVHRAELDEIAAQAKHSKVEFFAQSFDDLWTSWRDRHDPFWVGELVAQLQDRFTVVHSA